MKKNSDARRIPMPCRDAKERTRDFLEVAQGYDLEQAVAEANRCLRCKRPHCVRGCPVEVDIPAFIAAIAANDIPGAYRIIKSTNSLPAVCGRVCPQENQCEGRCVLKAKGQAVAIGRLERFVADMMLDNKNACGWISDTGSCRLINPELSVACIGSGPASLTAAGYLAARGFKVTVFEALHEAGGVLTYGIPEFRLPKSIVHKEVESLRALSVNFALNWVGGKTVTIEDLFQKGFKAVFIGVGAGLPHFLGIPGENIAGVLSANEYLTRINLGRAFDFPNHDTPVCPGKNVTVFGGGNVAMDAARTALRMGAENVRIVYRRTMQELPARREEVEHALEEGVGMELLSAPLKFTADSAGKLCSVRLQRMRMGEPDASGRSRPLPIEGEYADLETDLAIIAVGTRPNPVLLNNTPGLTLDRNGYIEINEETGETSIPGVYAGGDIVAGAATVIEAMGAGRRAARSIAAKLLGAASR